MANHNRSERLPGEVLAPADIRALLRACKQGPTGARNRALLVVLWRQEVALEAVEKIRAELTDHRARRSRPCTDSYQFLVC